MPAGAHVRRRACALRGRLEVSAARVSGGTRANREKVGTPMPTWRDGGVDGWIVFGGPARAGPGGGGRGRHARGGGAAGRGRPLERLPLGAGGPRRGASCRQTVGRRPEAADQRRGGGGA